jgi:hypothetical protein
MKTIEIKLYKFNELSEEAKQKAIKKQRESIDTSYIYREAHNTVKEFEKIFPTDSMGNNSWLDCNVRIEDSIAELTGERLRKYILNNFGSFLFKRKYLKHGELSEIRKPYHPMMKQREITNNCANKGKFSISYYSNIQTDSCCVLTGVCYDHSMLKPIYDFLDRKTEGNFEDILEGCYSSLREDLESEEEAMQEDSYLIEEIDANDYDFTEDGNIY